MENPRLVVYQKVYYVYYTTRDGLCVATSTDLINWTNHGTALGRKIYNGAVLMNPGNKAVKLDSQFVMYSSTASGPVISYSRDLIHWEIQNVEFDLPEKYKPARSEEHTSELQSLMRISYAVFCLKKQNNK